MATFHRVSERLSIPQHKLRQFRDPCTNTWTGAGYQQTGFKPAEGSDSTAFRQGGFQPAGDKVSTGFQQEGFQQGEFQQGGFEDEGSPPTDPAKRPDMSQGGFNDPTKEESTNVRNKGYEPPPGQQTTLSFEEFREIEKAVRAAQDALDKASSLIARVAFHPQRSTAWD